MPECKPQLSKPLALVGLIVTDPCLSASHNRDVPGENDYVIVTDPCLSASHNQLSTVPANAGIVTDPCLSASHNSVVLMRS